MTDKTTAALKLAEEVLVGLTTSFRTNVDEALAAIREALAEQEKQEPVAYIRKDQLQRAMKYPCLCEISPEPRSDRVEIYAAPVSAKREWVDLTEGEQESIYLKCNTPSEYINAAIAAFKEKNK